MVVILHKLVTYSKWIKTVGRSTFIPCYIGNINKVTTFLIFKQCVAIINRHDNSENSDCYVNWQGQLFCICSCFCLFLLCLFYRVNVGNRYIKVTWTIWFCVKYQLQTNMTFSLIFREPALSSCYSKWNEKMIFPRSKWFCWNTC